MRSSVIEIKRAAVAVARHRRLTPDDHEGEQALRGRLAELKIQEYVERVVSASPPLSAEAKAEITALLNGGVHDG